MIICPWKDIMRYAPVMKGLEEAVAAVLDKFDLREMLGGIEKAEFLETVFA